MWLSLKSDQLKEPFQCLFIRWSKSLTFWEMYFTFWCEDQYHSHVCLLSQWVIWDTWSRTLYQANHLIVLHKAFKPQVPYLTSLTLVWKWQEQKLITVLGGVAHEGSAMTLPIIRLLFGTLSSSQSIHEHINKDSFQNNPAYYVNLYIMLKSF